MTRLLRAGPSIEALYAQYGTRVRVDTGAPVAASGEAMIAPPAATVWGAAQLPGRRGSIDPAIHDVCLAGEVWPGTHFTGRNGLARTRSRFAVVDPLHELTWTGMSSGAKAAPRQRRSPLDKVQARAGHIYQPGTTERTVT